MNKIGYTPIIRNEIVIKNTKKGWNEWFVLLDAIGGKKMTHSEMARYLYDAYLPNNSWWCQMIVNNYERARGLRTRHEVLDGFQVTISKIIPIPHPLLYSSFCTESIRARWLGSNTKLVKAISETVVRLKMKKDNSTVMIVLTPKTSTKTRIALEHKKLKDGRVATEMKKFWKNKMIHLPQ